LALYAIGTEQIKGFAVTLILGILMSMYTAIFCSRLMFDIAERRGWLKKLNMRRILEKANFDFISKISLTSILSAAAIGIGLVSIFTLGPKVLDHDLRGGSTIRMVFKEPQNIDDLKAELAKEEIVVKDEKVEFSVSGFSGPGTSDDQAGRIFKVDSNLPAWEGGADGEKWEQLNEVMTRVFGDKLEMHNATIETATPVSALPIKRSNLQTAKSKLPMEIPSWNAVTASAINLLSPNMIMQDDGGAAADAPVDTPIEVKTETPVVEGDAPVISTDDPVETADAPEIQSDAKAAEESESPGKGSDTKKTEADVPVESTDSIGEDPTSEVSSAFDAGDTSAATTDVLAEKVTRKLSFGQPITGKTLKELMLQAAVALDLELEENALAVTSPDTDPGESSAGTVSKDWTVEMQRIAPENADDILAKWSEDFNGQPYFPMASKVGGQIAKNMQTQALTAAIVGLLLIIGYVWFRFQNLAFGLAAVIALLHDVAVVLGVIAITHYLAGGLGFLGITNFKISLAVVAAILTVIGYSLNDTIVVFDRIREVRGKRQEITAEIINTSISQTLSRTLLTSLTTFIVVFILYCFGGDAIHSFAFTLVIGVIVGTYSSINPMDVDPEVAAEN
jgi:SecD/SecF fusion protein